MIIIIAACVGGRRNLLDDCLQKSDIPSILFITLKRFLRIDIVDSIVENASFSPFSLWERTGEDLHLREHVAKVFCMNALATA